MKKATIVVLVVMSLLVAGLLPVLAADKVGGGDITYPGKTKAQVVFSHGAHATAGYACADCHTKLFEYKKGNVKMADMYAKKSCGTCHNGTTKGPKNGAVAFAIAKCDSCHKK